MVEEIEVKRSKRKIEEQIQETGRVMYMIKSLDEDLYNEIRRLAQEQGLSVTELIFDMVKKQLFLRKLSLRNMTVEQLLSAWDLLKEMMLVSARIYASMSTMFFSEMTEAWSKTLEEKAKKLKPSDDKFKEFALNILEPVLKQLVIRLMSIGTGSQMQTSLPKLNVPVEIVEK
ncbi:MAG: hypothetical protein ACXQTI_08785 [Candidatus Nezhaarchaeales archaeon]